MKLERPIIVFDLETTSVDTNTGRIVEIGAIKVNPDGTKEEKRTLVNPTIPIPPGATAVHGITDNDVKDAPTFSRLAKSLSEFFVGCDISGFNSDRFDVPLLASEFERCGISFPDDDACFVDVIKLERHFNSHTLGDTYKRHSGEELEGAHGALTDSRATLFILESIIYKNWETQPSPAELDKMLQGESPRVDIAGKLTKSDDGTVIWAFGKCIGQPVLKDMGFFSWVLKNDFPAQTKKILQDLYAQSRNN